jgi:serine/threonine-protein kinase
MNERPPGPQRLSRTEADTLDGARPSPAPASPAPTSRPPSSSSLDGGRFTPGAIVDARYRVVGLLGRGGMGEVYRAEDLRLGEPVALKFLPEKLVRDGAALARFHREVRTARLITHRNVVRVHDLGEVDGQPFLSMEYVDGEDLASLLRRIGRLPADKAVELAHQICSGLAAAHERGILHRDLKPGNVLVDGRGHAKITDFGLAALASDLEPELAGTPAYMAPEQLAEGKVSFATDVYSLGLVLYEMFSGRRPFNADNPAQLLKLLEASEAPRLSTRVEGLDRRIDDTVLRCLRREPDERPRSAMDVSAALPGGDPLAAALAAGETPSPEMVARAQGIGTLARPVALGLAGLVVAGIATIVAIEGSTSAISLAAPLGPEVMAHEARSVLALAGFEAPHDADGYRYTAIGLEQLASQRHPLDGWRELAARRPGFAEFWYRQADRPLVATQRRAWRVTADDPPANSPGTATVTLDGQGRLRSLLVVPDPAAAKDAGTPRWSAMFAASELPMEAFTPVAPDRAPPVPGDSVAAWTGAYPGQAEPGVRIEAAARGAQVISWQVQDELAGEPAPPIELSSFALAAFALMWIGAAVLARRHHRSGSGDSRGAFRLAAAVAAATFVGPLLLASHSTSAADELGLVFAAAAQGSMFGVLAWLVYMALEPYARRVAPRWVVSWTRLLEGRVRDPMVGRDLLAGIAASAATQGVLVLGHRFVIERGEGTINWLYPHGLVPLAGALPTLANSIHPAILLVPFGIMFVMVLSRTLLRREWAAAVLAAVIVGGFDVLFNGFHPASLALAGILIALGFRWGFLALIAAAFVQVSLTLVPIAADPDLWWSARSWLGWGLPIAVALYAYRIATARPIGARPPSSA